MSAKRKIFPYSIGFGLTVSFLVLCSIGAYHFLSISVRGFASRSWPETLGEVVSTSIRRSVYARGGTCFNGVITYRYVVDGRAYRSNSYDPRQQSKCFRKRSDAKEFTAWFSVGQRITVYYDPHRPSLAVLKPGLHPVTHAFYGLMGVVFLILIGIFALGARRIFDKLVGVKRSSVSHS